MKKLRSIIGILILVAGSYSAFKIIPVLYANMRFQQFLDESARQACYTQSSDQELVAATVARAQELDLPVTPEEIKIDRSIGAVTISVDYAVPVDLIVRTFTLNLQPSSTNHRV